MTAWSRMLPARCASIAGSPSVSAILSRLPAFLAFVICAAAARAAELSAALENGNLRLRKDAPIPLEVRIENPTPRLLEGRLEVTLLFGERAVVVHRGPELVLQPGGRIVPMLVPPPPDAQNGDGIAARLRWIGADGARDLGDHNIGMYSFGGFEPVLAVVRTDRRTKLLDEARTGSMRIETLRLKLDAAGWLTIRTQESSIAVENLPLHPIGWCAYDAVFLDAPAFAATNEKQLAALARWIEGGGSAAICADAPIEDRHFAFLKRLGLPDDPAAGFSRGDDGRLVRNTPRPGGDSAPVLLEPGLGRAVIFPDSGQHESAFARNEWRAGVAWMWKFRGEEQREIAKTGTWSKDFFATRQGARWESDAHDDLLWNAAAGFDRLAPGAPRQMPLALVVVLLGALLVAVGPADWFILGCIRRRRWTWVAFPVVCVAAGWCMVHLAGRYLGVADRTGGVRLLDVGGNGRVLREIRWSMILPAKDQEWNMDLRDAFAVEVPRAAGNARTQLPAVSVASSALRSESPSPGRFLVRCALRQWSPSMVRITAFPEKASEPLPDWGAAQAFFDSQVDSDDRRREFASGGFEFIDRSFGAGLGPSDQESVDELMRSGYASHGSNEGAVVRWITAIPGGQFLGGLGSAVSPLTAGLGDLHLAKGDSASCRILCAWRRKEGELQIYRRVFPRK